MKVGQVAVLGAALVLAGCVTGGERVAFRATNPNQQSMVRDGRPGLVSRQKNSTVLVGPAARELQAGGRPVFVVGINNIGKTPTDFRMDQIQVSQLVSGQEYPMQVVTYEMLAREEKNRQVAAAILTGVAAAGNSYSASRAGYGTYTTPRGHVGTFYSPTAAAIAQNNAAAQNEAMISATIDQGRANMAALEGSVFKDNTLLPGEWYGGQLHLSPPVNPPSGHTKSYSIVITIGADRHVIEVAQAPISS